MTVPLAPKYQGKVVVVTGARKGLGRLLAEYFLEQGGIVIGISRGEGSITHRSYEHRAVDVGDDKAVRAVFLKVARSHGTVDVLVNNAALTASSHALLMPTAQ